MIFSIFIPTFLFCFLFLYQSNPYKGWIRLHPESSKIPENITSLQQLKLGLPPEVANNQNNVGKHWEANPTWSGACGVLAKLDKPTLVITGTDDNFYQPHVNSLKIAEKIPGAWLVQCNSGSISG